MADDAVVESARRTSKLLTRISTFFTRRRRRSIREWIAVREYGSATYLWCVNREANGVDSGRAKSHLHLR